MKIDVLVSNSKHPVMEYLKRFSRTNHQNRDFRIVNDTAELNGGSFLFLVSCSEIVPESILQMYERVLVLHASDLPAGRGWSPHIWAIVAGKSQITVSLLEANKRVDTGDIWAKKTVNIPKSALYDEINHLIFKAEMELIETALNQYSTIIPTSQPFLALKTLRKRTEADSEIDPYRPLAEQFDLLRVCDPFRFPAFFKYRGKKFKLTLEEYRD